VSRIPRMVAAAVLAAALAVLAAGTASASVQVQNVDTASYPTVNFSVVTSGISKTPPQVYENGTLVTGATASNLGSSKSVVLAIDRSQSMAGASMKNAAAAADNFVTTKPATDAIGVVAFGSSALTLTSFSTSTIDADGALRSVSVDPHSGTALYDAVVLASNELAAQPARGRVIILLTDGKDVSSSATLSKAIAAAQSAHVAVYPIAIAGPEFTPGPLRQMASATGGTFFRASSSSSLTQVYSTIASQLARTWRINYLTSARPGDSVKLRVTVPGQGAAARDVRVPVGPGGASAPSGPSRLLPRSLFVSSTGTLAIALLVGLLVLLAIAIVFAAKRSVWLKRRVDPHVSRGGKTVRRAKTKRFAALTSLFRSTDQALGNVRQFRALARLLERAEVPLKAAEFTYLMLASAVVFGLFGAIVTQSMLVFFVGALIGGAIPYMFVSFKARRRLRAFDDQLPDLLVTLAASLKAGHSFRQGIQSVVEEGQEPASKEFKRVLTDTQLGRPMEDSLAEMAARVGSKNFSFVITAVTIQRQVGGSLATLIDMVAETVRQRQQFQRRIRALTAMGRMSAYVLVALPFFLAFMMTLINKSFMAPLWQRHVGHEMIILSLIMIAIGSAILKKIVSFKG